jgi:hypothetical protein
MKIIGSALFSILVFLLFYFLFRQYFEAKKIRKTIFKTYLIITPIAIVFALLVRYIYYRGQSESFKTGIDLLQKDRKILNQIGDFKSYTFEPDSLPKETDNPAKFKVALNGSNATIYLECTMKKESNKWFVKELEEDSLVKRK